jgi:hypothetical protein
VLLLLLQARALRWKLTTRRRDGAGDGFRDKHSDLTQEQLQQQEQHLVQQVRKLYCCNDSSSCISRYKQGELYVGRWYWQGI